MDPAKLKYSKSHEWVGVEGDVATVGISKFAVDQLTDLVYIELPQPGAHLKRGQTFGVVESVKAASDLYAPVSGEVLEANTDLEDDQGPLSADPFGAGWLVKLRLADPAELNKLMDRAAYEKHCESEGH
jgi:glycine cleavage system H protein